MNANKTVQFSLENDVTFWTVESELQHSIVLIVGPLPVLLA